MPPAFGPGESNGLISQKIDDNVKLLEYWGVACPSADREYWNDGLEMVVPFFRGSIG